MHSTNYVPDIGVDKALRSGNSATLKQESACTIVVVLWKIFPHAQPSCWWWLCLCCLHTNSSHHKYRKAHF